MDVGSWCNSGNGDVCWGSSSSTRGYDRYMSYGDLSMMGRSLKAPAVWTQLWRKIKKEKRRIFYRSISSSRSMRFSYDPCTYAQNFDEDVKWDDPDDLSRSFSARFAVPSRIFEKDGLVASR